MKLRTVLNGIAALAVVGGLYTFAFCMKDEVFRESFTKLPPKHSRQSRLTLFRQKKHQ